MPSGALGQHLRVPSSKSSLKKFPTSHAVFPAHLPIWKGFHPLNLDVLRLVLGHGTSLKDSIYRRGSLGFAVLMVPAGSCSTDYTLWGWRIAAMHGGNLLVHTVLLICLDLRGECCAGELVLNSVPCRQEMAFYVSEGPRQSVVEMLFFLPAIPTLSTLLIWLSLA